MRKQSVYEAISRPTRESLVRMEGNIAPALSGNFEALSDLLLFQAEAIKQGVPLTPKHAAFLSDALVQIARYGDPREAFHIQRKRGQKDRTGAIRKSLFLAQSVAEKRQRTKPRMSVDNAVAEVAEEQSVPEDTVRAAWRDYRKQVELIGNGFALVNYTPKERKRRKRR